jgi:Holliday junction resolvasome RuvABC endonuclease subunit
VTAPRVVGLDLSMTATGIADADGITSTVKPRRVGDARLTEIRDEVRVAVYGSDFVVIEDLPTHAHGAGITGMVHGAIRAMLQSGPPYVLVTPATLKKFATGRGNAGKPEMAVALFKRAGLELADDNQVDAWWLRAAGLTILGHPPVQVPAAQTGALAALDAAWAAREAIR